MKKKILFVSNMYPSKEDPHFGTFIEKNYNMLSKEYDVEKIVLLSSKSKLDKLKKYVHFFMKIFSRILKGKYTMIYVHFPSFSFIPLFFLKNRNTKNIVINLHGSDLVSKKILNIVLNNIFTTNSLKRSKKVIVPSDYFKKLIEQKHKIQPNKIFVSASGGIDPNIFYSKPKSINKHKIIGYCGRLTKEKGVIELTEAFLKAYSTDNELKLYIIGSGNQKKEIENIVKDIPKEAVTLFGGKNQLEVSEILNEVDIFVFPSWQESLGLVGIEAMSKKCLVIASDISGITSYLKDQYNGMVFQPKKPESLLDCLNKALNLNEVEREKIINNGYKTSEKYSSTIVEKLLLEELRGK